jgi:hypothetical protein
LFAWSWVGAPVSSDGGGKPARSDWVAAYYDALEFFWWEPQHLGRKKHASAQLDTLGKVSRHIHGIEVTLNQLLNQFFLLAPVGLRAELFEAHFGAAFAPFDFWGADTVRALGVETIVQPDLLFVSDNEVVCIEMKVRAKCSVTQVLKYALLGVAVESHTGRQRSHSLLLLGKGDFSDLWQERFVCVAELEQAMQTDVASFLNEGRRDFRHYEERFREVAAGMRIEFMSYAELAGFLQAKRPPASEVGPSAEVYRKLIDGLVGDLDGRRLTSMETRE